MDWNLVTWVASMEIVCEFSSHSQSIGPRVRGRTLWPLGPTHSDSRGDIGTPCLLDCTNEVREPHALAGELEPERAAEREIVIEGFLK